MSSVPLKQAIAFELPGGSAVDVEAKCPRGFVDGVVDLVFDLIRANWLVAQVTDRPAAVAPHTCAANTHGSCPFAMRARAVSLSSCSSFAMGDLTRSMLQRRPKAG